VLVVCEPDPAAALALVLAALADCRPCAVIDSSWPAPLRRAARVAVTAAAGSRRVGAGDLVVFTSGSTGRPRGVVRSVASWRASASPLAELAGIGPRDVVWLPGPMSSSLFLHGGWHAAHVGATPVAGVAPPPAATVLHAVPAQLAAAVDAASALPRLRVALVAGDALPAGLRRRAEERGWRVLEYYGAAELSFVGYRWGAGPFTPFPGARVAIRDGEIWVRSPYLARGYLTADDRGPLREDGGWMTVGDRGAAVGDGFAVLGRGDAAVTTGGHTVLVEEVEAVLRRLPGVDDVAVIGLPNDRLGAVVAAVVVLPADATHGDEQLAAAARELPAPARPRRWYLLPALPRTAGGKVDRPAVLAAVRSGAATRLR
jgi:acyl-coenzyme A synthetase/AMP-(fatty) acid ligase